METDLLLEILSDQKLELAAKAQENFCDRAEEKLINLKSKKAQVVIGVRRSGKSTLCFSALHKAKVNFAYVNFDDERFSKLKAEDLNEVLRCLYQLYGEFQYLFLDEMQNIAEWYLFVNRLLRQGMHVIITGSNANLLSGELATHLTGRHNKIELYPFSFAEYCVVKEINIKDKGTKYDALRRRAFDEYLKEGGFPEIVNGEEEPGSYIQILVDNIIERDIKKRFKVRYIETFRTLAGHLMNNAPCEVVHEMLKKQFSFKTSHTVKNYFGYLQQAYLLLGIHKYSNKSKERINNEKAYVIDVALLNARKDAFAKENMGWRLETVVYLELKRRYGTGYDIYYYQGRSFAVDFVVCRRNEIVQLIQVSYDISGEKTRNREINGLVKAADAIGATDLLLLTPYNNEDVKVGKHTIKIRPCYEWMLQ